MNFRQAKPKQDSTTPHLSSPPVWDHPKLVELAQSNDLVLAQATERLRKPMAKTKFQVAREWIRRSYWITLALLFALALSIRIASLIGHGKAASQTPKNTPLLQQNTNASSTTP